MAKTRTDAHLRASMFGALTSTSADDILHDVIAASDLDGDVWERQSADLAALLEYRLTREDLGRPLSVEVSGGRVA